MRLIRIEGDAHELASSKTGAAWMRGHDDRPIYIDPTEVVAVVHGPPYGAQPHTEIWLRGCRNAIVVAGTVEHWVEKLRVAAAEASA